MMMNQMNQMNQMGMNPNMMNMAAMMMGNMQQMNNNNQTQAASSNNAGNSNTSQTQKKDDSQGGMSIIFRVSGAGGGQNGPPLTIQCLAEEKVSDLIQRYRTKANDHDTSKKFIFNAKALNTDLSVAEAGLTNNANVFVVTTKGVKGAH